MHSDPFGIIGFIIGLFLIPFALILLWKNERKVVMYSRVIEQGREEVKNVDSEKFEDANDFKLVHVTGDTESKEELTDSEFAISVNNSYRLRRKIEMYQWQEKT